MKTNFSIENIELFIAHSNAIENEPFEADEGSLRAIEFLFNHEKLTPELICKAHGFLMREKNIEAKFKGSFRDVPVWIGGVKKDNMISIPNEVLKWCDDIEKKSYGALVDHIFFENIHPFIDGNGRIGRLLFLWQISKLDQDFRYFDAKQRREYYKIFEIDRRFDTGLFLKKP